MNSTKIWEENVSIPTYEVGKPDKNPMFLEKRVYQGSSGKIYPYMTTQDISREKKDVLWKAVFLENEYLKIMVLPELGGRIQRAYDKTNGYDFVYYNHVIKPALVGLLGPWISGGIEFNWPQHHRPTTYMPVDYRIGSDPSGRVSIELGDVDEIFGTKAVTRISLYPGKAYIEIKGQLYNRTSMPQTFLWWANPAVSVNDNTQSIFPPDVHSVYDHGKRAVSRFPIATGEYYKHDYSEGVDISRYKNIPVPTSYMAEKSKYNFVGGYDYKKKAGLLHVADHHVSPGKKQWTWGCGDFGKAWDRNLTDADGPYIELMTGMYCDNQPDFTWLKPFEEKTFYQYFMPYKEVGQVKNATIKCILNVEKKENGLYICAYGTEIYDNAEIRVIYDDKEVFSEKAKISPNDIYEKTLSIEIENISKCKVSVLNGSEVLVSYQQEDQGIPKLADPAKAPDVPEKIMTNEELFLAGQHIEQYRHATFLPDPYYKEGLKRDSGDIRINNAVGLLNLRRGCFIEAEGYFRVALKRLTNDDYYPNPYDSEPYYNLGLTLFYQKKYEEAYDAFYKATWSDEQKEMSYYYLAVITTARGKYNEALDFIEKSLVKNLHNVKARGLKAFLLLKSGKKTEAEDLIEKNLEIDEFDYVSLYLRDQLNDSSFGDEVRKVPQRISEISLQMARDFMEFGDYEDALRSLESCDTKEPMNDYYRGVCLEKLGMDNEAVDAVQAAENDTVSVCFPNKLEDINVLLSAVEINPKGSRAYYYLGNLYYDKLQYDRAIVFWEKSERLDGTFPTVKRNLAIAYYNKRGDRESAKEHLEQAFKLDRNDARVFLELDQLHKKLGMTPKERIKNYIENPTLIDKRDDLYAEYVTLLNMDGQAGHAHQLVTSHRFRTWEGAEGRITTQFKTSLLMMALANMRQGNWDEAGKDITEALSYPENLGEGHLEGTKDNNLYYYLGIISEKQGRNEEAASDFEKAALGKSEPAGMMYYYDQPADMILYQGLAKRKLSLNGEAYSRFYKLIDYGERHLGDKFKMDYFAVSMPDFMIFDDDMEMKNRAHCYYLMGLGKMGLGNYYKAKEYLQEVLKIEPYHQNAALYLEILRNGDERF